MKLAVCVAACAVVAACGGSPTGPTRDAARTGGRLSRTRFLAFGDSITVGEVTNPIGGQLGVGSGEWGVGSDRPAHNSPLTTHNSPLTTLTFPLATSGRMIAVPAASYPTQLQSQLRSRYAAQASDISVINAGVGGERLTAGILRFEDTLSTYQPEVVLLMEGVNDLRSLGPDISTDILAFMAQQALSRNMRVFLGSMLPTVAGGRLSQPVQELVLLNSKLQAMAVQRGVVYVDLYNMLLPEAEQIIGADGLHPTEAGYRRVADVFLAAIRAELEVR